MSQSIFIVIFYSFYRQQYFERISNNMIAQQFCALFFFFITFHKFPLPGFPPPRE
jgi:hypothetical protein